MFENARMSILFSPMRDQITGEWIKLHKEELHDLNSPANIVGGIKWRRKRWAAHEA
jgi:hypothetical protein